MLAGSRPTNRPENSENSISSTSGIDVRCLRYFVTDERCKTTKYVYLSTMIMLFSLLCFFLPGANTFQQPALKYLRPLQYSYGPAHARTKRASSRHLSLNDNLVSGLSELSIGFGMGTLWSEYNIIETGCGPLGLSDWLERSCYEGVLVTAGIAVFNRLAFGRDLATMSESIYGFLEDSTLWQVRTAEILSLLAVLGAFVAIASQLHSGQQMDGLSGIDQDMCAAFATTKQDAFWQP